MKKVFTLFVFLFISMTVLADDLLFSSGHKKSNSSDGSFAIGLAGDFNSTWMLNPEVIARHQTYGVSFGGNFGISLANYFTDNFAVVLDVDYSMLNQKYTQGNHDSAYTSKNALTAVSLPFTLLYVGNSGSYVEAGVQLGIVNGANYTRTGTEAGLYNPVAGTLTAANAPTSANEISNFNKLPFSGILGFGMEGNAGDNIAYDIGFRFSYGFSNLKGVDALGVPLTGTTTTLVTGGIHIGVKYMLRY